MIEAQALCNWKSPANQHYFMYGWAFRYEAKRGIMVTSNQSKICPVCLSSVLKIKFFQSKPERPLRKFWFSLPLIHRYRLLLLCSFVLHLKPETTQSFNLQILDHEFRSHLWDLGQITAYWEIQCLHILSNLRVYDFVLLCIES